MNQSILRFDTRNKKPKLYHIALITAAAALILVLLSRSAEAARIRTGNFLLVLYFGVVAALLVAALRGQIRYNPYSYNTIIYTGFALFCIAMMTIFINVSYFASEQPELISERQILLTLVNSAKHYILVTSPFLAAFSVVLFYSNVSLIRHEGRRFVNILGMILSVLLVTGIVFIALLDRRTSAMSEGLLAAKLVVNLASALYLYFECMVIGAVAADWLTAVYEAEPDKDFLIVLGCGLRADGTPTPLLQGRLDRALRFWRDQRCLTGKEAVFVCSGGQGPDEAQSEAASMAAYLRENGVPETCILLEDRSTDTAENMRFSKEKIESVKEDGKIAFFTTNYHVFRSGLKARRVKMRAVGMGAPTRWYFWPNASVREFVGLLTEHRVKQGLIIGGLLAVYTVLTVIAYR